MSATGMRCPEGVPRSMLLSTSAVRPPSALVLGGQYPLTLDKVDLTAGWDEIVTAVFPNDAVGTCTFYT